MRYKDTKTVLIIAQRNYKLISFLWFSVALYGESVRSPPFGALFNACQAVGCRWGWMWSVVGED